MDDDDERHEEEDDGDSECAHCGRRFDSWCYCPLALCDDCHGKEDCEDCE